MKKILCFFFSTLAFVLLVIHPVRANIQSINSIHQCLPKPLSISTEKYQFSIAAQADTATDPWRWFLVRVRSNPTPMIASKYSVISVKRNNRCINYDPMPTWNPNLSFLPPSVTSLFKKAISKDVQDAHLAGQEWLKKKYPGMTQEDLRRRGLGPLD